MGQFSFDSKENIDGWHDVLGGMLSGEVTARVKDDVGLAMGMVKDVQVTMPAAAPALDSKDVNLQGLLNEVRGLMQVT